MNKKEYVEFFLTNEDFREGRVVTGITLICSLMRDFEYSVAFNIGLSDEQKEAYQVYLEMAQKLERTIVRFRESGKWKNMQPFTKIPFIVNVHELDDTIMALNVGLKLRRYYAYFVRQFLSDCQFSQYMRVDSYVAIIKNKLEREQRLLPSASRKSLFEEI